MNTRSALAGFQSAIPIWRRALPNGTRYICDVQRNESLMIPKPAKMLARKQLDSKGREYIRLDGFLKLQGLVESGGEAKSRIQEGEIGVNGEVETRRGRKLREGDKVSLRDETFEVEFVTDLQEIEAGNWK